MKTRTAWYVYMKKRRNRDKAVCGHILREIADVRGFLGDKTQQDFLASTLLQKATVMSLLNIGELSKSFSDAFLDDTPWMPWDDIRSTRNLAAHTYAALDMRDVWETWRVDLPELERQMHAAIEKLTEGTLA